MKNIFIACIGLILFTSCEDVIKKDIQQKEVKLIIDAFVSNELKNQEIILKRSINYFDKPGTEPPVLGATVAILDTSNILNPKLFLFADSGQGKYIFKPNAATGDTFTIGRNYALVVIYQSDTFVSVSKLNPTVNFDSLHIVNDPGNGGIKAGKYIELFARDLLGTGNTYWIKTFRNDSFKNRIGDLNIAFDEANSPNSTTDGGLFIWPIRYGEINDFGRPWVKGEKAKVEVHSITNETFYYFRIIEAENFNGGLFATPPSAIPTNIFSFSSRKPKIKPGGWFNMAAVEKRELIIP